MGEDEWSGVDSMGQILAPPLRSWGRTRQCPPQLSMTNRSTPAQAGTCIPVPRSLHTALGGPRGSQELVHPWPLGGTTLRQELCRCPQVKLSPRLHQVLQ